MTDLNPAAVERAARAAFEEAYQGADERALHPWDAPWVKQTWLDIAAAALAAARAGDDTTAGGLYVSHDAAWQAIEDSIHLDNAAKGEAQTILDNLATPVPSSADDLRAEAPSAYSVVINGDRETFHPGSWGYLMAQALNAATARAEAAEREVADLRAGINALADGPGSGFPYVPVTDLRALAGSGEQPGEPGREFCKCQKPPHYPHRPAPVVPDDDPFDPFGPFRCRACGTALSTCHAARLGKRPACCAFCDHPHDAPVVPDSPDLAIASLRWLVEQGKGWADERTARAFETVRDAVLAVVRPDEQGGAS